jgi:hypothetical protein
MQKTFSAKPETVKHDWFVNKGVYLFKWKECNR